MAEIISTPHPAGLDLLAETDQGTDAWDSEQAQEAEIRVLEVAAMAHGERLDKWLATVCAGVSRSYLQTLLLQGAVSRAGVPVLKPATRIRAGEQWHIELRPTAQASAFLPESMPLDVVYEDEALLVVNKPVGLVVHPAAGHWQGTLLNGVLHHHPAAVRLPRAGIVHRLDKDTSGLMVVGKTQAATEALSGQIARREVHRLYLAMGHGQWQGPAERRVERPIGRDPRQRLRMAVHAEGSASAKLACTDIRLLSQGQGVCWVGCKLHTGRTHQIRVHMASIGHPLVGDALYGGRPLHGLDRQALHAWRLVLRHPLNQRVLRLEADLPADLQSLLSLTGLDYNPEQMWQVDLA